MEHLAARVGPAMRSVDPSGAVHWALATVAETAGDVAGIVVRNSRGNVVGRSGESWSADGTGVVFTDSLRPVVVYRAPIPAGEKDPEVLGQVEVAVLDADRYKHSPLRDLLDALTGMLRRLVG